MPHQRHDAARVEDEPDAAVAENGAARHPRTWANASPERLDDDFLLAEQLIDQQRHRPSVVLDDDGRRFGRVGDVRSSTPKSSARLTSGISASRTLIMRGCP